MSTLYFPQLATGTISQFPSRKSITRRTVVNRSVGNRAVKMADPEAASNLWELQYSGLTDNEVGTLQELFAACEGRLRSFQFLDPSGNLLRWTEDLAKPVWQTSALIASGIADPNGGTAATRLTNAAQAAQRLIQGADAPGWYRYTFSIWARSESTDHVVLGLESNDGLISSARTISPEWERISISGEITGSAEEIRCFVSIPAACAVDVYGPQLDAQGQASGYRKTMDTAGLFAARFDQEEFECVSYGPDNHSTAVRVVTVREVLA